MKKLFVLATFLLASCASPVTSSSFALSSSMQEESVAPTYSVMSWNVYLGRGNMTSLANVIESYHPDIINFQECTDP